MCSAAFYHWSLTWGLVLSAASSVEPDIISITSQTEGLNYVSSLHTVSHHVTGKGVELLERSSCRCLRQPSLKHFSCRRARQTNLLSCYLSLCEKTFHLKSSLVAVFPHLLILTLDRSLNLTSFHRCDLVPKQKLLNTWAHDVIEFHLRSGACCCMFLTLLIDSRISPEGIMVVHELRNNISASCCNSD